MAVKLFPTLALGFSLLALALRAPAAEKVVGETFKVPALDPGIELAVGNKRLENRERFDSKRIVLFVHGATFPAETGFDLDLPGGSWMEFAARRGFDAYYI